MSDSPMGQAELFTWQTDLIDLVFYTGDKSYTAIFAVSLYI